MLKYPVLSSVSMQKYLNRRTKISSVRYRQFSGNTFSLSYDFFGKFQLKNADNVKIIELTFDFTYLHTLQTALLLLNRNVINSDELIILFLVYTISTLSLSNCLMYA